MSVVFMNTGLDAITQGILGKATGPSMTARLFQNNFTPSNSSNLASFTECTLSGYSAAALTGASWTGSTSSGISTYTYPTINYTFSSNAGTTTIYGYYISNSGPSLALFAELFVPSYAVPSAGGALQLSLTWTDKLC